MSFIFSLDSFRIITDTVLGWIVWLCVFIVIENQCYWLYLQICTLILCELESFKLFWCVCYGRAGFSLGIHVLHHIYERTVTFLAHVCFYEFRGGIHIDVCYQAYWIYIWGWIGSIFCWFWLDSFGCLNIFLRSGEVIESLEKDTVAKHWYFVGKHLFVWGRSALNCVYLIILGPLKKVGYEFLSLFVIDIRAVEIGVISGEVSIVPRVVGFGWHKILCNNNKD